MAFASNGASNGSSSEICVAERVIYDAGYDLIGETGYGWRYALGTVFDDTIDDTLVW